MTRRLRLSLEAWRRLSKKIDVHRSQLRRRTSLAYCLSAVAHSSLWKLQEASHADVIKTVTVQPPVFLLGFWRSGTTLLHELLCCDSQFGFPSTYACLNPSHFLLTESWSKARSEQLSRRPMDAMPYSWSSPQEDEFALLALGAPSPYEALIVPSLMRDPAALVDLRQRKPEEQERWVKALQSFLRLLTVQQRKTIVLKSPPHGFKLPLLLSVFPQSRFVVIERNPYEVFASNLKLWTTLLDLYAVESSSAEEVEQFVLQSYLLHEQVIAEGMQVANPHQLFRIRYEDLVADPMGVMERLYGEWQLADFDTVREPIEKYTQRVKEHTRNRFVISAGQRERVEKLWGAVIKAKNYSWPESHLQMQN